MRCREANRLRGLRRPDALLLAAVLGLSAGACEEEVPPPIIRTLDSPTDMAFACRGRMRVTGDQPATAEQPIVTSPMPVEACRAWHEVSVDIDDNDTEDDPTDDVRTLAKAPPAGQGPLGLSANTQISQAQSDELFDEWQAQIQLYGFALQRNTGTVAVIGQKLGATPTVSLLDADPYSPGRNVIPVGSQPVGIATDLTGCHVMTANAGSCDLSIIDVAPVVSGAEVPVVHTVPLRNAAGEPLAARPRAIVAEVELPPPPMEGEDEAVKVGFECGAEPDSLVWVAFPDCHAVAAVHAATGEVRASVLFAADGSAVLGDGNLTCGAATCGAPATPPVVMIPDAGPVDASVPDAGAPDAGAPDAAVAVAAVDPLPRPVALHMAADGKRLYIGAENSRHITIVDLGADALPAAVQSVELEGEVGVTALAATDSIEMGGATGKVDEVAFGAFRFVYAAATDSTVRVALVEREGEQPRECDTQIDPRYLHDETNGGLLACLPLDPARRRVGARSPGIHMPGDGRPLDIAFVETPGREQRPQISTATLIGHFAYISLSSGQVVVVNVDDDNYGDIESAAVPVEVDMSLALPHQLRDAGLTRRSSRYCEQMETDSDGDSSYRPLECDFTIAKDCAYGGGTGGLPAMTAPSVTTLSPGFVAEDYLGGLPGLRTLECVDADGAAAVHELGPMAPDLVREGVFPDLQSVRTETWNIVWEGILSQQNAGALDPGVRLGYLDFDGGFTLHDGGSSFCAMGAQAGDVITLRGCEPERGNADCRLSEVCAVLPDIEASNQTGMCVPAGKEGLVQTTCLPFFSSQRRFRVEHASASELVLGERKRVLRTTPEAGCSSATQCAALYELEQDLAAGLPLEAQSPQSTDRWVCEPDSLGDPARNVCLMTCASDLACELGWQCSSEGYCVEAALPPAECVQTLQRYDVRVGNAFALLGSSTGFLHNVIMGPGGECVLDGAANSLALGRVPLTGVEPCTGEGFLDVSPNPCATTVSQFEGEAGERQAPAIRFRNPAFVTHLVDPVFDPAGQGIDCTLDGAACPPMQAVPPGYAFTFTVGNGFVPLTAVSELRYPVGLAGDPLGSIWIMDQGDVNVAVRGQIARFAPLTLQVTAVIQ
jgi:hypothetical protein